MSLFCDQPTCARRIFAERLPGVVEPYARRTVQLTEALTLLGFALGGEAGARLARRLADVKTTASPDTLLRLVRRYVPAAAPTPRVLGVDDFAFHRGIHYGTILVDLERHKVVDLLPDRETRTFAAWLRAHPGIGFISRDRSSAYADAAQQASPQAVQVADRFHLLANLGMTLDRLLTREHHILSQVTRQLQIQARLDQTAQEVGAAREVEAARESRPATTRAERQHLAAESRRRARYEHLAALRQEGHSIQTMARLVGMARNTVRRYLPTSVPHGLAYWAASSRSPDDRCAQPPSCKELSLANVLSPPDSLDPAPVPRRA
ncbi:MAG: ISL3 family transposase [Ktedonobacterales bacterium]